MVTETLLLMHSATFRMQRLRAGNYLQLAFCLLNCSLLTSCSQVAAAVQVSQSGAGAYEVALAGDDAGFAVAWYDTRDGNPEIYMRLLDESGKLSLNRAGEGLLKRVVTRLLVGGNATEGVSVNEQREIETVVHSILDWRDPDDLEHLNGAEADYYASLRRPYPIKNG